MASISTGGGGSGKKSVDHSIPLVPFIDLLLCCDLHFIVYVDAERAQRPGVLAEPRGRIRLQQRARVRDDRFAEQLDCLLWSP